MSTNIDNIKLLCGKESGITEHESQMLMEKEWICTLKPVKNCIKRNRKRVGKWTKSYSAKNTLRWRNTVKSGY